MVNNQSKIGSKTLRLQELKSLGLNVPDFTFITNGEISILIDQNGKINEAKLTKLANSLAKKLPCEKYAVRSSALIEDSKTASFAGQFKTLIDVKPENLDKSIEEVIRHAFQFLKGKIECFSILIQQYIQADFSGITFSRNPLGSREMLIEYHHGIGEDIVSGKIKPEKFALYWHQTTEKIQSELPSPKEAIENFKKIENFYKCPQDIEWCIKDDKWYFLQTRPITTISETQYQEFKYLDQNLPKEKFYFAKTEISEIAPRPTQFTLDLLEKIYGPNGPIEKVYKKHHITYFPSNFLKIIGNELYVDREAELKTLLPSYSYLNKRLRPSISTFSGLIKTLKNIYHLGKISLENYQELFQKLKTVLEKPPLSAEDTEFRAPRQPDESTNNVSSPLLNAVSPFLKDYELIFEVNLLAGVGINKLKREVKEEKLAEILSGQLDESFSVNFSGQNFKGNCLEISDQTQTNVNLLANKNFAKRNTLSKQNKTIYHAQIYNHLRELGRWLTIKRINEFRKIILAMAKSPKYQKNPEIIYFAKISELLSQNFKEADLIKRKAHYESFDKFELPSELSWTPISNKSKIIIISPGTATGILVTEDQLLKSTNDSPKILYTKILSPHLAKHFPQIKGLISEQGGLLSHLAILCRESKIPAIVGINLQNSSLKLGEKVDIPI